VYELKVDGGSILRIWKNNNYYTKDKYQGYEEVDFIDWDLEEASLKIRLNEKAFLSHILISFGSEGCNLKKRVEVNISEDGKNWKRLIDRRNSSGYKLLEKSQLYFPFTADLAKHVSLRFSDEDSCISRITGVQVYKFPSLNILSD
jgi:hypothetical protein